VAANARGAIPKGIAAVQAAKAATTNAGRNPKIRFLDKVLRGKPRNAQGKRRRGIILV
jgi:hypothetical protein